MGELGFPLMSAADHLTHCVGQMASYLFVLAYPDEHRAAEVLAALQRLRFGAVVDPCDVACVTRRADWSVTVQHTAEVGSPTPSRCQYWQMLVSSWILVPGAAQMLQQSRPGMDDGFGRHLCAKMPPGSSALFVIASSRTATRVSEELDRFGGTVLCTRFTSAKQSPQTNSRISSVSRSQVGQSAYAAV
jgi:uncharacterized membrane protein